MQSKTAVTIVTMLNTFVATHFVAESQTGRKVGTQGVNRRAVAEEGALPLLVRSVSLPSWVPAARDPLGTGLAFHLQTTIYSTRRLITTRLTDPIMAHIRVWRTKVRLLRYDAPANSMAATVLGQVATESEELKKAVLAEGAVPELQRLVCGTFQPCIIEPTLDAHQRHFATVGGIVPLDERICARLVRGRYATQRAPCRQSRQRPLP